MIFVTVGTHEQPFDRLIIEIDRLKKNGVIREDVFIQTGYCTYEPVCCDWKKMLPYDEMEKKIKEARIVITHGGPASFIAPLSIGKTPIVVPRQKKFGEHVNDHQFLFSNELVKRGYKMIVVNDIAELSNTIDTYDVMCKDLESTLESNSVQFAGSLKKLINRLFDSRGDNC